jgi:two-component system response regulator (stage 0 sporulation protein F)
MNERLAYKIVVVEDNDDFRNLILQYLLASDFSVKVYESASQLLEDYKTFLIADLIIMDIKMPGVNGLDFLRITHGAKSLPPIITMSAFGSSHEKEKAIKWGAADFIKKPFYLDDLKELMFKILNTLPSNEKNR